MLGRKGRTLSKTTAVFGLGIVALTAVPRAAAAPQYAGGAACRTCHPAIQVSFFKNPHFKSQASGEPASAMVGCESCHGPASDHIAAKGDKTKIAAFSQMQPGRIVDACLRCHAESLGRASIRRSSHTMAGVACTSCHSIHKPASQKSLLAKEQREVCYGCHAGVRAQFSMPFKHRVNEGLMTCADCHNPHGAEAPGQSMGGRPRMMAAGLNNEEPCMKCHNDKRGPFAFEHAAVRVEGCASCHVPHGTSNARMLKRPAVFTLCLECHNGAGSFGRQGDGIALTPSTHTMGDPRFRNCTTCHVRIHGSNSDRSLTR